MAVLAAWFAVSVVIVVVALTIWLSVLTARVARWRREQGEPVFRRLPDDRWRFRWEVIVAYSAARRAVEPPTVIRPSRPCGADGRHPERGR